MDVGDAGAEALAAALSRSAMPRLKRLYLSSAGIWPVSLTRGWWPSRRPCGGGALQRRPALEGLNLWRNPLGDERASRRRPRVAPPPPAGTLSPPTGGLAKLKLLNLSYTKVSDTSCATLASALDGGALLALGVIQFEGNRAKAAVNEALTKSRAAVFASSI